MRFGFQMRVVCCTHLETSPPLWLLVFGSVVNRLHTVPTGGTPYLDYIAPGILAQGVLFMAIFYGITSTRERDTGIIVKFLVSPAPRATLVCGKVPSAGVRQSS
jgi:ABC-2 type transport system permease protein